jgi:hypothetical protein
MNSHYKLALLAIAYAASPGENIQTKVLTLL